MALLILVKLLSVRTHKGYICPNLVNAALLTYSHAFLLKSRDLTVMTFIKPVKQCQVKKLTVATILWTQP